MNSRKEAMIWWNNLSSLQKTQICDVNTELVGAVRRWETLTGREVELLYEEKNKSDREIIESVFANPADNTKNKGTQRSPFSIGS